MKKRILYLDRIKGFTILLMVLAHVYMLPLQMGDNIVFKAIGSFHMHLFMFISGFVAFIPSSKLKGEVIFKKWMNRFISYLCPAMMVGWILTLFQYIVIRDIDLSISSFIDGAWYLKCMAIFCSIQFLIIRLKHLWHELLACMFFYCLFIYGWRHSEFLNHLLVLEHCTCFSPSLFLDITQGSIIL